MLYFTSDTHLSGSNSFSMEIVEKFHMLKATDTVIHLGDFSDDFTCSAYGVLEYWRALPCRKELVLGNHDMKISKSKLLTYFDHIHETTMLEIELYGNQLLLSHFPVFDNGKISKKHIQHRHRISELSTARYLVHGHVHPGESCFCCLSDINCFNTHAALHGFAPVSEEMILDNFCCTA
jgi:calcineurin-like phosphoesterase family protein